MSYTLYHGCVASAVDSIINGRFNHEQKGIEIIHPWICSLGNDIFFYDKELFKETEGMKNEEDEYVMLDLLRRCNEQAQIQNACLKSPFEKTCVLECTFLSDENDLEINSWEDIATPDISCDNMSSAVCMTAKVFNSLVEAGKVIFKVHEFPFYPKLALFYIASIAIENNQFNQECLTSIELNFCRKVLNMDYYLDELIDVEEDCHYEIVPEIINDKIYYFRQY